MTELCPSRMTFKNNEGFITHCFGPEVCCRSRREEFDQSKSPVHCRSNQNSSVLSDRPFDDLLEHTKEGVETLVRLGEPAGMRTSSGRD